LHLLLSLHHRHLHNLCHLARANPPSCFPRVWDQVAFGYPIPRFGSHRVLSPKTTLTMPNKRSCQRLNPDEGLPQASDQNKLPFHQQSNQTLSTIAEESEHPTFSDIPELQLHQPATMSTTATGSSQNDIGDMRQSPPRALPSVQEV
jgi:hypothetical protein